MTTRPRELTRVCAMLLRSVALPVLAIGLTSSALQWRASAAEPALSVYCAPGTAPTCFGVGLATTADGNGGTEVTLRLANYQGASGLPVTLPAPAAMWSRLYRVDIHGPDDGSFSTDDRSTGVALTLSGGATALGDTSMTSGVMPLIVEPGVTRGFAVGTDITTSGAEIVGCTPPPDLDYPSIRTCATGGQVPEVALQFATSTAWNASQVTVTLLFQDPTGEYACLVSESKGTTAEPLRCERIGGPAAPPASQAVSFSSIPPSPAYVGQSYTAVAAASSGLPVTFASASTTTCGVAGSVVTFVAAGTCIFAADQPGNDAFLPAPQVTQSFEVVRRAQSIAFVLPLSGIVGQTIGLSATSGGSGNAVSFASLSSGVCTVSGPQLQLVSAGTCTVAADQAGSVGYEPAARQTGVLTVTAPPATFSFTGFRWPVVAPPALTMFKAGLIFPLRFGLGGNRGLAIFAPGSPKSALVPCSGGEATQPGSMTATLADLPLLYTRFNDEYLYAWKTDRRWSGTCRILTIELVDGSSYSARFSFR